MPARPNSAPAPVASPAVSPAPARATAQPTPSVIPDQPSPEPETAATDAADDWHAFVPNDTADHLATMDRAARESGCGVPWQLLAAIARVESDFGRNMATSSAGAIGYGQFLPSSWQAFGNEGNAYDYRDALPAIARYLCGSGLARDPRAALFAYNHADWYVDLVLSLAVRYDRLAPGAPTPEVLSVGPREGANPPLHYAAGRDVGQQSQPRSAATSAIWLGVPWRGRTPGTTIDATSLQTTTLGMLRAAFGITAPPTTTAQPNPEGGLFALADRAWASGLLPLDLIDELGQQRGWSIADVRRWVRAGRPVLAVLGSRALPGHLPDEPVTDQPVAIVGLTPTGLVYSDPSFSSSLGYGLELSDEDFEAAWQAARVPHQALALGRRPSPLARQAHLREAEPPPVTVRVTATPRPQPEPTAAATPIPTPAPAILEAAPPTAQEASRAPAAELPAVYLLVIATVGMGVFAMILTRLRGRRS